LCFFFTLVDCQANFATSKFYLDVPGNYPSFSFGTLYNGGIAQQTNVSLLQVAEMAFVGELPPQNSVLIVGSTILSSQVPWAFSANNINEQYAQVNLTSVSSGRPTPSWSGLTMSLYWDEADPMNAILMDLSVNNYQWFNDSSETCLTFFFAMTSPSLPNMDPISNGTAVNYGSAWMSIQTSAIINDPTNTSDASVPVWIWINNNDIVVVQIAHFQGSMSENITLGTYYPYPPPSPNNVDWPKQFGIFVVGIALIIGLTVVLVVAGGIYLRMQSSNRGKYEAI